MCLYLADLEKSILIMNGLGDLHTYGLADVRILDFRTSLTRTRYIVRYCRGSQVVVLGSRRNWKIVVRVCRR